MAKTTKGGKKGGKKEKKNVPHGIAFVQAFVHAEGALQRLHQEGREFRHGQQVGKSGHGGPSRNLCDDRTIAHPRPLGTQS